MSGSSFRLLCCDIGGVLGTNGWDADLRHKVCLHFHFSPVIDERHRLMFDTYERGFVDLERTYATFFSIRRVRSSWKCVTISTPALSRGPTTSRSSRESRRLTD